MKQHLYIHVIVGGIFFLLFNNLLSAQKLKGYSVSTSMHYGWPFKHKSLLLFDVEQNSVGLDINFSWQTFGRKAWHEWHQFPKFGLDVSFFSLGNKEQLGEAFGFTPNFEFFLIRRPFFQLGWQVGVGLAYLNTTYHAISNSKNNAISASLNNMTTFRLGAVWRWRPMWSVIGGGQFTHYSNGATTLPNFGLNMFTATLGLQYTPLPLAKEDFLYHKQENIAERKWGYSAHIAFAYREYISPGGPKYPIYIASLGANYSLSNTHRLIGGMEYEFNRGVYEFGLHSFDFATKKEARQRASRYMLFLADEILFGEWSIVLHLGTYVSKRSFLKPFPIYSKLIIRYYLPAIGRSPSRIHLSATLKSHKTVAEYVSLGIGVAM